MHLVEKNNSLNVYGKFEESSTITFSKTLQMFSICLLLVLTLCIGYDLQNIELYCSNETRRSQDFASVKAKKPLH